MENFNENAMAESNFINIIYEILIIQFLMLHETCLEFSNLGSIHGSIQSLGNANDA